MEKCRQYLINYSITGTQIGTTFIITLDFPTSKIGKNANETAYNLFECIMNIHNDSYKPKIDKPNVIGIVSMNRLD